MSRKSGILEGEGETRRSFEPAGRPFPTRQCFFRCIEWTSMSPPESSPAFKFFLRCSSPLL
jgi:hypothetical protein